MMNILGSTGNSDRKFALAMHFALYTIIQNRNALKSRTDEHIGHTNQKRVPIELITFKQVCYLESVL